MNQTFSLAYVRILTPYNTMSEGRLPPPLLEMSSGLQGSGALSF